MILPRPVRRNDVGIDLTPLIDVVLQLLIFFMLTSSFISQPGIKINLPRVDEKNAALLDLSNLEIRINERDEVYVGGTRVKLADLPDYVRKAAGRDQAVHIQGDIDASWGAVVGVWDICKREGVRKVEVATTVNRETE